MIGTVVVHIIIACAIAGAVASAIKPESELGQQFVAGVDSIGPIFLPVAGVIVFGARRVTRDGAGVALRRATLFVACPGRCRPRYRLFRGLSRPFAGCSLFP